MHMIVTYTTIYIFCHDAYKTQAHLVHRLRHSGEVLDTDFLHPLGLTLASLDVRRSGGGGHTTASSLHGAGRVHAEEMSFRAAVVEFAALEFARATGAAPAKV